VEEEEIDVPVDHPGEEVPRPRFVPCGPRHPGEEVPVELRREDVQIERVPASGNLDTDTAFQEEEIDVPVMREEAVVGKEARATEKVRLNKTDTLPAERVVSLYGMDAAERSCLGRRGDAGGGHGHPAPAWGSNRDGR
jgi:hypothetical protein